MAARLGLEPRQAESESAVLPLHHQAVYENLTPVRCFSSFTIWKRLGSLKEQAAFIENGAGDGNRTRNRLFTKQVLYH